MIGGKVETGQLTLAKVRCHGVRFAIDHPGGLPPQRRWVRRALADILLADRMHRPQLRQQFVDQRTQTRPRRAVRE